MSKDNTDVLSLRTNSIKLYYLFVSEVSILILIFLILNLISNI